MREKNTVKNLQIECRILYLCIQQKYIKNSTKKENSNRSLNKLTNETIDNQPVNVPKNYEQEQEQKKTTKRVEKVDDVDDVVLEEKEYLLQPLRYLPQPLRRRGAQTTYKPDIPPQILLQTSPRIQAYKRLTRPTPLAVFPARADTVQHSPGPQARSPSLWEGRGRFLEDRAGHRLAILATLQGDIAYYTGSDEFKYECILRLKLPHSLFNLMAPIVVTTNRPLYQRSALC